MGFSRKESWIGLPCPPPGDFPDPGIKLVLFMSPALAGKDSLLLAPPGKPEFPLLHPKLAIPGRKPQWLVPRPTGTPRPLCCYRHEPSFQVIKVLILYMLLYVFNVYNVYNALCISPIFNLNLFLIGGLFLYNIVLVSALYQHESATGIHTSPLC